MDTHGVNLDSNFALSSRCSPRPEVFQLGHTDFSTTNSEVTPLQEVTPAETVQPSQLTPPEVEFRNISSSRVLYKGCVLRATGAFHGEGELHVRGKYKFKGQWKHGKKDGFGIYRSKSGYRYEGEWQDNLMHGSGKETTSSGMAVCLECICVT